MATVAKVTLWGNTIGAIAWDENRGFATFEYDRTFIKKGLDLSPLQMPLENARRGKLTYSFPALNKGTFKGLPGLLADSLPDTFGNRLIDAWLAQQGRDSSSFNPVERLCYIGKRGMGALEYEPVLHPFGTASNPVEIERLVRLAQEVFTEKKKLRPNIHRKTDKGLLEIIRVGTSAGGARPKAVIAYNKKTGDVRSGQIDGLQDYEYWIIKFDGVSNYRLGDPKGYGKIEYAYHLMAKDCGIRVPECIALKENKRVHFMSRRFDREGTKKLHMQTLCAIAHFDYNDPMAYSYEQAFQVMRRLKLPYTDMKELYCRMVFNVLARDQDDHTKNISFLMDREGVWRLSPAYDVTYAYDPANKWMKAHQMSINGKREDINKADLLEVAKKMNIKKPEEIINTVTNMLANWSHYAQMAKVHTGQIKAIRKTLLLKM